MQAPCWWCQQGHWSEKHNIFLWRQAPLKFFLAGLPPLCHIRGRDSSINQLQQIARKPAIHGDGDTHLRGCVGQLMFHSSMHKAQNVMFFQIPPPRCQNFQAKSLMPFFPSPLFPRQIIHLLSSLIPDPKFNSISAAGPSISPAALESCCSFSCALPLDHQRKFRVASTWFWLQVLFVMIRLSKKKDVERLAWHRETWQHVPWVWWDQQAGKSKFSWFRVMLLDKYKGMYFCLQK